LAASIKFYPALFIVYFLVQKEFRAIVVAFTTTIICMGLLPWLSLGDAGLLTFHHLLGTALDQFSSVVASSPFSNFIANAVTHAAFGRVDPTSWLYQGALVLGRLVGCLHVFLLWRSLRIDASRGLRTGLTLGLASIPFLVRSCWVHYFVFLPFLHGSILQDVQPAGRRRIPTVLVRASVAVSAALISFPMLFLVGGGQSYYEGGWPFWATVVLLPGLYMQAFTKA
jgi:hypothetical protein